MHDITSLNCSRIAQDLQIRKVQVEAVVGLLDEGNTVPFITRYRKERTGGLNEEVIRQVQTRIGFLRHLAERKQTISEEHRRARASSRKNLSQAILKSDTTKRLEDLYIPFKPKKRSQASKAREQGLEPASLGDLVQRSRGDQPRRNVAGFGQSGKGTEGAGRRADRCAKYPRRDDGGDRGHSRGRPHGAYGKPARFAP